ncbi:MAG: NAD-dependent epimerase/dehydratase family protein [Elusimicrobiota bacterium]
MTVLVTGAPGWLGTRLVETLLHRFEGRAPLTQHGEVRCLAYPGQEDILRRRFGDDVRIVRGDITCPGTLGGILDGVGTVFHAAGLVHAQRVKTYFDVNTEGTKNLLAKAIAAGVRRFIFVSSNAVYGFRRDDEPLACAEEDPPRPYMAYGWSKLKAEQAVLEASRRGLIEGVVIRPCWYYGPNQPHGQIRFLRMIASGRPILFGGGRNWLSLSHIDNVIQALLLAADSTEAASQVYNVADRHPCRLIDYYSTVARHAGIRELRPLRVPSVLVDACYQADRLLHAFGICSGMLHGAGKMNKNMVSSIEKAKRELGYDPAIELDEGMRLALHGIL